MYNIRGIENSLTLDESGLQYISYQSASAPHLTPSSPREAIHTYLNDISSRIKEEVGADQVIIFDYKFRINDPKRALDKETQENDRSFFDPPGEIVHVDLTDSGAANRLKRYLSEEENKEYLGHPTRWRIRVVNAWRPTRNAVYDNPLAFCEYHTCSKEDLVIVENDPSKDNVGEIYNLRHNEKQRWVYLDAQDPTEVTLFMIWDSAPRDNGVKCEIILKSS